MYKGSSGQGMPAHAQELLGILQSFLVGHVGLPHSADGASSQQAALPAMQRAQLCGACTASATLFHAAPQQDPAPLQEGLQVLR